MEDVSYEAIENIKDGIMTSNKYKSTNLNFETKHVIVFCNHEPDFTKLSRDRWEVRYLHDKQLTHVGQAPKSPIIDIMSPSASTPRKRPRIDVHATPSKGTACVWDSDASPVLSVANKASSETLSSTDSWSIDQATIEQLIKEGHINK